MAWRGYDPDRDVPDLLGKVFLVTGGTGGIGRQTVIELAKHAPAHIFFTGRNRGAADDVVAECKPLLNRKDGSGTTFLECDHGSLESIRAAANVLTAASDRLDVFIANAGIMAVPPGATKDGFEVQFGINHMGNASLLLHLLPLMLRTAAEPGADVRFVSLTSLGYYGHPRSGINFDSLEVASTRPGRDLNPMATWTRYGQSKLANILTAAEMRRRHPQITSVAVHPGTIRTSLITELGVFNRLLIFLANPRGMATPRQGSFNTLWAATAADVPDKISQGVERKRAAFFVPVGKPNQGDGKCWDSNLAGRLWDWTSKKVGTADNE
ncbi:hypothetical protein HIM_01029 [Hirsutella minnesotensis 3608]|nr:hypothetical protein HIM_01029 [Hirsutella minnesotensis 3608]